MPVFLSILGVLVLLLYVFASTYNGLIRRKNQLDNAEGSVNVCLKKRHDLIPNLTACVQFDQEQQQLRLDKLLEVTRAINPHEFSQPRMAQEREVGMLSATLLSEVAEVQNDSLVHLQYTWTEMEEQISASRRFYNTAVSQYNTAVQSFPGNLLAGYLNMEPRKKFDIPMNQKYMTNNQLNK